MSRIVAVVSALGLLILLASPARAATKTVKITQAGTTAKVAPDPVRIIEGDTVTFDNQTPFPYAVCATATSAKLVTVPPNGSQTTAPLAEQTLAYYLVPASCTTDADLAHGTIEVGPAPTTTTAVVTTTTLLPTTSTPATTTTTAPTTTTSTKSSTTTSTSSTTSTTTAPTVTATGTGKGGGNGAALLLGAAVIVVAGLAAAAFVAYRRSDLPPTSGPDDEPGPGGWNDGPPPTQIGPTS